MTDKQSNQVDSINNVIRVHNDYAALIATRPAVADQFALLIGRKGLINAAIGGQSGSIATNKPAVRKALDDLSFGLMAPVKGWAVTVGDTTIKDDMDHSLTDLGKVKDDTYPEFLRYRKAKILANIAALGGLGITAVQLDAWELQIVAYEAVSVSPRQAIINRKLHTENLDLLIKDSMKLMTDVLDGMMVLFKNAASMELYQKYTAAREIIDLTGPGDGEETDKALITVLVKDSSTNVVIEGATCTLTPGGQVQTTDAAGVATFDAEEPGVYNCEIAAAGYIAGTLPIDANVPGTHNFNYSLVPMP